MSIPLKEMNCLRIDEILCTIRLKSPCNDSYLQLKSNHNGYGEFTSFQRADYDTSQCKGSKNRPVKADQAC